MQIFSIAACEPQLQAGLALQHVEGDPLQRTRLAIQNTHRHRGLGL